MTLPPDPTQAPGVSTGAILAPTAQAAWRSPRAWLILVVVAFLGLVSDLATKYAAFMNIAPVPVALRRADVMAVRSPSMLIPPHEPVVVVPRVLNFTLVANPGAVFGIGAGKRLVFVGFTFVAIALGLALFGLWTHRGDWLSHAGVGLLIAGGVGNLYDRVVYACVRDFIHPLPGVELPFGWEYPWGGREVWPYVSNVADLWLIVAILVLLYRSWRPK